MLGRVFHAVNDSEEGHGVPLIGSLLSIIGLVLLGIGAANGTGWMAVVGGIVAALGSVATLLLTHMTVEYGIFARLEDLESKRSDSNR